MNYLEENPLDRVDKPKSANRILPGVNNTEVDTLIKKANNIRDKAIISLLADSGMRLSDLADFEASDIDWDNFTIIIVGKGNKQRKAFFTERTANFLQLYLSENHHSNGNIWGIQRCSIENILKELRKETEINCNTHSFRRGFACNLHRKGLSTLDIMYLGGWEGLDMVLKYTRSITFDDCLKHYKAVV